MVADANHVPPAIVVPDVRWQEQVGGDVAGLVPCFAHFDVGVREYHGWQTFLNLVRDEPRCDVHQHVRT